MRGHYLSKATYSNDLIEKFTFNADSDRHRVALLQYFTVHEHLYAFLTNSVLETFRELREAVQ